MSYASRTYRTIHEHASRLSRSACVQLLESVCIESYDSESLEILREAVATNVEDGTIDHDCFFETKS